MPTDTTLTLLQDARARAYATADTWRGRDRLKQGQALWLAHTFDPPIMRIEGTWRPMPRPIRRPSGRPVARSRAEARATMDRHFKREER